MLVLIAGCISGDVRELIRYDKATDSFVFVTVFANIATKDKDELAVLPKLWAERQNLMHDFNPRFDLFAQPRMLLRVDHQTYQPVDLASARERPMPIHTNAKLDKVKVTPGRFFKNKYGNLCYNHQSVVPGSVIDEIIKEAVPEIADAIAFLCKQQLEIRATSQTKPRAWDDLRQFIVAELLGGEPPETEVRFLLPLPLETGSLRELLKCFVNRSFTLTRNADKFILTVPFSESDCNELLATFDLVKDAYKSQDLQQTDEFPKNLPEILNAITLTKKGNSELVATISVNLLTAPILKEEGQMPAPNADLRTVYLTTIASVKAKGIRVEEKDVFTEIVSAFTADSKK